MAGLYLGYLLTETQGDGGHLPVMTILIPAVDYITFFSAWISSGFSTYRGVLDLDNIFTYSSEKAPEGSEFDDYIKRKISDRGVLNIALMNLNLFSDDYKEMSNEFNILTALNSDDTYNELALKQFNKPRTRLILYTCPYFATNKIALPIRLSDSIEVGDKLRLVTSKILEDKTNSIPLFKREDVNRILYKFYLRVDKYLSKQLTRNLRVQDQLGDELRKIIEQSMQEEHANMEQKEYLVRNRAG